jgi:hypothetical protein
MGILISYPSKEGIKRAGAIRCPGLLHPFVLFIQVVSSASYTAGPGVTKDGKHANGEQLRFNPIGAPLAPAVPRPPTDSSGIGTSTANAEGAVTATNAAMTRTTVSNNMMRFTMRNLLLSRTHLPSKRALFA